METNAILRHIVIGFVILRGDIWQTPHSLAVEFRTDSL